MSSITGKRGAWLNQFAMPSRSAFVARARQVDYVVLKYGMGAGFGDAGFYERLAHASGVPWLAEVMGENGVGSQNGPAHAITYADRLANQARQPGCIGAVINLEEADGGWHTDVTGAATVALIERFRARAPGVPLFASIDTRGGRPQYAYQRVLASKCEGVMPMIYPSAFQQPPARAFASALNGIMLEQWRGREIIPTIQTYDASTPDEIRGSVREILARPYCVGANFYTLGHANAAQWDAALSYHAPASAPPAPVSPPPVSGLVALRAAWVSGWHAIEQRGTLAEAEAYAQWWKRLTS